MDFRDIVALQNKKTGCELINQRCYSILNNPNFWLKMWTMNGLTNVHKVEWIRILKLAKTTNQEEDVLRYIKKVIQRGHFVSVPCYIDEKDLEKFLNMEKTPYQVNLAIWRFEEPGIVQLVSPLIKSPNALNRGGETPIIRAAKGGYNKDIVKILAPIMVNFDSPGLTPIHNAAKNGDVKSVKFMVAFLALDNPNTPNKSGATPIHCAALSGHMDMIKFLAAKVENPNPPDSIGWTPIHNAALRGHVDVITFLAAKVDNPNAPNKYGVTPIKCATRRRHQEVLDVLNQYVN